MNGLSWKILLICCFFAVQTAHAGEHEIDKANNACNEKAHTTAEMLECASLANDMWDKELNTVYQRVMKGLDSDTETALRKAQRRWLAFRDAEFIAISSARANDDGTIWGPIRLQQRATIIKDRVLQLESYDMDLSAEE